MWWNDLKIGVDDPKDHTYRIVIQNLEILSFRTFQVLQSQNSPELKLPYAFGSTHFEKSEKLIGIIFLPKIFFVTCYDVNNRFEQVKKDFNFFAIIVPQKK